MADQVDISMGPLRRPTWSTYGKDFANMVKAFIGSNYLTIAFAFSQSGLGLGLVGVLLIASLTAHCCNLIIKCKYHAINHLLQEREGQVQAGSTNGRGEESSSSSSQNSCEIVTQEEDDINSTQKQLLRKLNYGDVGSLCFGKLGLALVNIPIVITQFGFCIAYYIFIGNSIQSMFPLFNCSVPIANTSQTIPSENPDQCFRVKAINSLSTTPLHITNMTDTVPEALFNSSRLFASNQSWEGHSLSHFFPATPLIDLNTATSIPWSNLTRWVLTRGNHVPDLKLLVLIPVPFFIFMALIRSLRRLGWISLMANAAIMVGCGEVLYFLISGFAVSDSFIWVNWKGIPIFFGLVTSAFEGIGTIMPIEGSMEGNRHNFTKYLYGAVTILAVILSCFGTMGYLHYGSDIEQMVNANIPSGTVLNIFVNVSLCIGVLLTFPLMMFPVADLAESFFFGTGCCCCCGDHDEKSEGEGRSLVPKKEGDVLSALGDKGPRNIPGWKRNILRLLLVLCAAGFAVLLRNYFAYISAFVGALGSTMLAYILPCLFHLRLCWSRLPLPIKIKDIAIIVIGVCLGVAGMYSVIHEILS